MTDKVVIVINGQDPLGTPTQSEEANPYWMPGPEGWARAQVRQHHNEALYRYGEYTMFVLMWRREDFDAGLVTRCTACFGTYGDIADVFQQPAKERCDTCFGTTYEGGVKARIVRPAIWQESVDDNHRRKQGEVIVNSISVQSTSDFRMRNDDFILRADGTRWSVSNISGDHLVTGFAHEGLGLGDVAFNVGTAKRQDEGTVAYDIPPATALLQSQLAVTGPNYPFDFSSVEEINGPLIPTNHKPEA